MFGYTHTMGWHSQYNIPFRRRVRVTMQCDGRSVFWFRVGGAEDVPIRVGGFQLPSDARLHTKRFEQTVGMGALGARDTFIFYNLCINHPIYSPRLIPPQSRGNL
jgi:hypothetical protein